jgi:hypothetical protein
LFALRKYYNQFVYLIVSRSGNVYVLFLWCWVYLIHFLCCFTHSNDKLYIWLTSLRPSPIFSRLNVYICYFVIFNIYSNITSLNATDISFMNYRLIIYMEQLCGLGKFHSKWQKVAWFYCSSDSSDIGCNYDWTFCQLDRCQRTNIWQNKSVKKGQHIPSE